jgi:transcriptional regulator with GAF, ATPase, and Fis domain
MVTLRTQLQHLVTFDQPGRAGPTLLLQGETGTGKSLVARVVHDSGARATGPFLTVNCVALPESMLEAEVVCLWWGWNP